MKLAGKVAVIAGGNSGIGPATAREFKANGAKVVIFGRSRETLDQAVTSLGSDVLAVQRDVRNLKDLERLFSQTRKRLGAHFQKLAAAMADIIAGPTQILWYEIIERGIAELATGKRSAAHSAGCEPSRRSVYCINPDNEEAFG
jgi:NAD(P)-dependent dehydrogenase (short-subunit alcohol dehydrogenase family)